ncbi:hypothetical protein Pogu_1058 [Pyrobaculum oguniense TE7]|uniref:4Fe-4S ferredoxin-type domain-containing protein n=1 Tax=Pyrobaculum oguniense (strain DSM 13380 / JCM 10595 / TE7) TaxID=698757 RepID=H6Q8K3_PYROT|nr:hypothetical protein Pogu_1058 [Pyrobaculum oguniense TE7]
MKALVVPGRCVREWSAVNQCTLCADACPVGAISFNKGPEISEKCTACGVCMRTCPVEAIVVSVPYSEIAKKTPIIDGAAVLQCGWNINCIGHVDDSLLYYLAKGARRVLIRHCPTCPRGVDVGAEVARIQSLGLPVEFEPAEGAPPPPPEAGGEKIIELARRYVRINEIIKKEGVLLVRGIPEKRQLLNEAGPPQNYYVLKAVDPQMCDYLGTCAAVCPTGALQYDGKGRLLYTPALCVKCKNCVLQCRAITNAEPPSDPSRTVVLVSFKLARCRECGQPYPKKDETGLCPACRREREELKQWFGPDAKFDKLI